MAITHTTQLARGGSFTRWITVILVAGAATMVAGVAGRAVFTGDTEQVAAAQPSIHNLLEGIDESFTGIGTAQATTAEPSLYKLFPGIDEFSAPVVSGEVVAAVETVSSELGAAPHFLEGIDGSYAATEVVTVETSSELGIAPHFLEGIDGSYQVAAAAMGPSAYTVWKLEQVRGDVTPVGDSVTPSSQFDRPNLVEGL